MPGPKKSCQGCVNFGEEARGSENRGGNFFFSAVEMSDQQKSRIGKFMQEFHPDVEVRAIRQATEVSSIMEAREPTGLAFVSMYNVSICT
jgi:hypothetical protein